MEVNKTRTINLLAKRKLTLLRGTETEPVVSAKSYGAAEWTPTEVVSAVSRKRLGELVEEGHLPGPHDVLCVRVRPGKRKDRTLSLSPQFERKSVKDILFPQEQEEETFDVHFVCVYGEGPEVETPGLSVVDVSDPTPTGYAPQVEVSGLGKAPKGLAIEIRRRLRLRLHDELARPMTHARYRLELGDQVVEDTTEDGWVVTEVPADQCFAHVLIEWGPADADGYSLQHDLMIDCEAGCEREQAVARLHNLGYASALPLEEAVRQFQRDYGLEVVGLEGEGLPAETRQRLWRIYGEDDCDAGCAEISHHHHDHEGH